VANASTETHSRLAFLKTPAFGLGLACFAFALLIRLVGIGWGLPNDLRHQSLHPDEPIIWIYSQQIDPAKGDFDPGFYNYGSLYLTTMSVVTRVVDAYGGGPTGPGEPALWQAIGRYHLAGRIITAVAGAGTAWVVFALLRRRTHVVGATLGAAIVAVAPGFVVHSRFQTVDVPATFLLALSLFWALELALDEGTQGAQAQRAALLSGLFAGLSAGTKYTGILALIALVAVVLPRPDRWRRLAEGSGAALVAFAVATPGVWLNPTAFLRDFRYEMTHTATGHGLVFAALPSGFSVHVANLALAMGPLLLIGGGVGLGAAAFRRYRWAWGLLAYSLAYYVLIGRAEVLFLRYVLPLVPVLAVGLGWAVGQAHAHADRRWRVAVAGAGLAVVGIGGGGLITTILYSQLMTNPDPRDAAAIWLKANAAGRTLGFVSDPWFQSPPVYPDTALPRTVQFAERDRRMREARNPQVVRHVPANPNQRADFDPALLTQERPDYIVTSSFETDDLARVAARLSSITDPSWRIQAERYQAFTVGLRRDYQVVRAWGSVIPSAHDLMYVQPRVTLWQRRTP